MPQGINTDKNGCYPAAIKALKEEGVLASETLHRQVKCLNNIVEADHGKLKRLIKPTLGFESMKTADATIKGFEAMRAIKKADLHVAVSGRRRRRGAPCGEDVWSGEAGAGGNDRTVQPRAGERDGISKKQ
ncbi:hypothetical protein JCM14635_05790 [Megalodesulfovibrio paquesii]